MIERLPEGVAPYKRTPTFTQETIPAGLLNDHQTKEGTWGLVCVEEGELRYIVTDPRRTPSDVTLSKGTPPGIVEPTILHRVEPIGTVRFHVEFWKLQP